MEQLDVFKYLDSPRLAVFWHISVWPGRAGRGGRVDMSVRRTAVCINIKHGAARWPCKGPWPRAVRLRSTERSPGHDSSATRRPPPPRRPWAGIGRPGQRSTAARPARPGCSQPRGRTDGRWRFAGFNYGERGDAFSAKRAVSGRATARRGEAMEKRSETAWNWKKGVLSLGVSVDLSRSSREMRSCCRKIAQDRAGWRIFLAISPPRGPVS